MEVLEAKAFLIMYSLLLFSLSTKNEYWLGQVPHRTPLAKSHVFYTEPFIAFLLSETFFSTCLYTQRRRVFSVIWFILWLSGPINSFKGRFISFLYCCILSEGNGIQFSVLIKRARTIPENVSLTLADLVENVKWKVIRHSWKQIFWNENDT